MTSTTLTHDRLERTWAVDPVHSEAAFSVRHLVGRVHGRFDALSGRIHVAADPRESSVQIEIAAASVNTHNDARDRHLRSSDFLDVARWPTLTFVSTRVQPRGEHLEVTGLLTIASVTREVEVLAEVGGVMPGHDGVDRTGFHVEFDLDRRDYGITTTAVLETGGVMVGDRVAVVLDVQAVAADTPGDAPGGHE